MPEPETTVAELCALIALLPGTSVLSTEDQLPNLSLLVCAKNIEALAVLEYCACGANVTFNSWSDAPRRPISEWANPLHLRYKLLVTGSDQDATKTLDRLQLFGVFLVWYLHNVGALPEQEANRLLRQWKGKQIDA